MNKTDKNERKLLTDFYMWMVENDYDHNIRIRAENKAELFLRDRIEASNGVLADVSKCNCGNHIACMVCSEEKGLDGDFWKRMKEQ